MHCTPYTTTKYYCGTQIRRNPNKLFVTILQTHTHTYDTHNYSAKPHRRRHIVSMCIIAERAPRLLLGSSANSIARVYTEWRIQCINVVHRSRRRLRMHIESMAARHTIVKSQQKRHFTVCVVYGVWGLHRRTSSRHSPYIQRRPGVAIHVADSIICCTALLSGWLYAESAAGAVLCVLVGGGAGAMGRCATLVKVKVGICSSLANQKGQNAETCVVETKRNMSLASLPENYKMANIYWLK